MKPLLTRRPVAEPARPVVVSLQSDPDREPAPDRASSPLVAAAAVAIFVVAVATAATVATGLGYWWVTPLAGVAIGAVLPGGRPALGLAAASGLAAWGLPLLWMAARAPVARTASVVAAIMGLTGLGGAGPIILTLVLGMLLCVSGAWVGLAARRMIDPFLRERTIG